MEVRKIDKSSNNEDAIACQSFPNSYPQTMDLNPEMLQTSNVIYKKILVHLKAIMRYLIMDVVLVISKPLEVCQKDIRKVVGLMQQHARHLEPQREMFWIAPSQEKLYYENHRSSKE